MWWLCPATRTSPIPTSGRMRLIANSSARSSCDSPGTLAAQHSAAEPAISASFRFASFRLELAVSLSMPLVIHSREADADTCPRMQREMRELPPYRQRPAFATLEAEVDARKSSKSSQGARKHTCCRIVRNEIAGSCARPPREHQLHETAACRVEPAVPRLQTSWLFKLWSQHLCSETEAQVHWNAGNSDYGG